MLLRVAVLFFLSVIASAQETEVRHALGLSLSREDLPAVAAGVQKVFLGQALEGSVRGQGPRFAEPTYDEIRYHIEPADLRLTAERGRMHATLSLRRVTVLVPTAYAGIGRLACEGLRGTSYGDGIPVAFDFVPQITHGGRLRFAVASVRAAIDRRHFRFETLRRCRGLGPLSGLLEPFALRIANGMKDEIESVIAGQVEARAEDLNRQIDRLFEIEFLQPLLTPSIRAFVRGLRLYPSAVAIDESRVALAIGARFPQDRSRPYASRAGFEFERFARHRPARAASFAALSTELVDLGVRHGLRNPKLAWRVTSKTHPALAILLRGSTIASLVPEAGDRFDPDADTEVELHAVRALTARPREGRRPGAVEMEASAVGADLRLHVAGAPYYRLALSATFPVRATLDARRAEIRLTAEAPRKATLESAAFLLPGVTAGGATQATLDETLTLLGGYLAATPEAGEVMRIALPRPELGGLRPEFHALELPAESFVSLAFSFAR